MFAARHPSVDGGRQLSGYNRLLRHINISHGELGTCPRRLSKNVHRHIVVTVTVTLSPRIVVVSRPAATLSIIIRHRVLHRVAHLGSRFNFTIVFVARSLPLLLRVSSHVTIVHGNRVIRVGGTVRLCARPRGRCATGLLSDFPSLANSHNSFVHANSRSLTVNASPFTAGR